MATRNPTVAAIEAQTRVLSEELGPVKATLDSHGEVLETIAADIHRLSEGQSALISAVTQSTSRHD